jgi:hypothetical protein
VKKLTLVIIVIALFFLLPKQSYAFNSASDSASITRPSASTPLGGSISAGDGSVALPGGATNLSVFLASDSAKLWGGTQELVTIASASADRKTVWFTGTGANNGAANGHAFGTMLTAAITAKHVVSFKLNQTANVGDILRVSFPGTGDNSASPSATTFAFNNLQATNTQVIFLGGTAAGCTMAVSTASTPYVQCTVTGAAVPTTATVVMIIGSNTPALINPTKTNTIGTSDLWKLTLNHFNASLADMESPANIAIAAIENVFVQGIVDASITITIAGMANNTVINTDNTGCAAGFNMTTNSGGASSPTSVNLGTIGTNITYVGQKISIATNGQNGYVLTATASGRLLNPANGYWFGNAQGGLNLTADNAPIPAAISGGTEVFGISACGTDATTALFGTVTAAFGNPSNAAGNAFIYKLASKNVATASVDTSIVYGVTAKATTPAGTYQTVMSYIATPIF